jgi:hypothetical protein
MRINLDYGARRWYEVLSAWRDWWQGHLDGKGQIRHLDLLLSLEHLRGIQWIPGDGAPPAEEWLPLLKRIREGGKLCQVYVTADAARKIIKELGGKGFALEIVDDLIRDQAERLVEELTHG